MQDFTNTDYMNTKIVFKVFKFEVKNLSEYHDFYLK